MGFASQSAVKQKPLGFGRGQSKGFLSSPLSSFTIGGIVAFVMLFLVGSSSYFILQNDFQTSKKTHELSLEQEHKIKIVQQRARQRAKAKRVAKQRAMARQKAAIEKRVESIVAQQELVKIREQYVRAAMDRAKRVRVIQQNTAGAAPIITGTIKPVITSASGLRLGTLSGTSSELRADTGVQLFERSVSASAIASDTSTLSAVEVALLEAEKKQLKKLTFANTVARTKAKKLAKVLRRQGMKVPADSAIGGPLIELKSGDKFLDTLGALDASLQQLASLRQLASRVPAGSPTPGQKISSRYGGRRDPFTGRRAVHGGLDFRAKRGVPVRATAAGIVVKAGRHGGYGNLVEIDHGHGVTTRYAHLSRITVKIGTEVVKGERVGKVGSTGRSTGPHLHYEVRRHGKTMDPLGFVNLGPKLRQFL